MTAEKARKQRAPAGLGGAGRALWARMTGRFVFEPGELVVLEAAARQADANAAVEELLATEGLVATGSQGQRRLAGAVAEARQGRLALARLLGQLALPSEEDSRPLTEAGRRAQKAANARWARKRAVAEQREGFEGA